MNETEKNVHKEEAWVRMVCEQLQEELDKDKENKYIVKPRVKLLHKISLNDYMILDENNDIQFTDINLSSKDMEKRDMYFNVDLFVGERMEDNHVIPRIVVEAKYLEVNTHDPITYNYKAKLHKMLYPGLRYGLMIGNYGKKHKEENCYIPVRCVEFGDSFDFVLLFKDDKLTKEELNKFVEIIKDNFNTSKELEKLLVNKDNKCWYITRDIQFDGKNSTTSNS